MMTEPIAKRSGLFSWKGESLLPDICKNYVIYYVVLDHRIMEVRRFFYKRLVFSDNRCSNRFFLVSAGIFVG